MASKKASTVWILEARGNRSLSVSSSNPTEKSTWSKTICSWSWSDHKLLAWKFSQTSIQCKNPGAINKIWKFSAFIRKTVQYLGWRRFCWSIKSFWFRAKRMIWCLPLIWEWNDKYEERSVVIRWNGCFLPQLIPKWLDVSLVKANQWGLYAGLDGSDCNGISASEEQCMAGWTFRPVVKWQPGAGGSLGQHSFSLGKQPGRAGPAGEGQGTPTNLPPKDGCSPGGRGAGHLWVPAPSRAAAYQAARRTSTVGKSQRATRPHSKHHHHQPNSFFLETFIWAWAIYTS